MQNRFNNSELSAALKKTARDIQDPAGRPIRVLAESDADALARQSQSSLWHVYTEALHAGIWPMRYMRNSSSLSVDDQLKLMGSRIAVIGAGGLGGSVLMLLARMGIGTLVAVDSDAFDESNLNRQLFADIHSVGIPKVETVKHAIAQVNPAVSVIGFHQRFTEAAAGDILTGVDVAVDALDNVPDRLRLCRACQNAKIPLVHAAVAGFEGQVMTIYPEDIDLSAIYGEHTQHPPSQETPEALMGVPAVTPALLASLQVMETIKILLGRRKHSLSGRMLYVNLEDLQFETLWIGGRNDDGTDQA